MSPYDSVRKPKKDCNDTPDPDLLCHVRSLGLGTVEDYVAWCARNGFSRRTKKHWRQRLRERSFATRAAADARLAQKKRELRNPRKSIESILCGDLLEEAVTLPYLKAICRACKLVAKKPKASRAFHSLLQHVVRNAEFFDTHSVISQDGCHDGNTYIGGLLALALMSKEWIRPVEEWLCHSHNARRQFSALARHLFARWPVPTFMDSAWFKGVSKQAVQQQKWFLHIGRGDNIRTSILPISYTKRMAHYFMQAPSDLSVEAALRWGQLHGLGASDRLTRAIIGTRLGTTFDHDDFWITVLQFFIANPTLDLVHIGPIVDYIHNQRFVEQEVFVGPAVRERQLPPQPNFTMKGRTAASLLRQVQLWHGSLVKTQPLGTEWPSSGIESFEFIEGAERGGNLKVWTITELLGTKALVAEGRTMKHCVASYYRDCIHGASSIWTLQAETYEGHSKLLTIEVNNQKRLICQVRGKCNAMPGEKHMGILRRWAEKAGLQVASQVGFFD